MLEQKKLISVVGIDYSVLRDLLAQGKWQEADLETSALMLRAAKREAEGWCSAECLASFPCEDLQIINELWLKYSLGRFGFTVQVPLYFKLEEDFAKLGEYVGWKVDHDWLNYSDLTFDLTAPVGHLPSGGLGYKRWLRWMEAGYFALAQRVVECKIV